MKSSVASWGVNSVDLKVFVILDFVQISDTDEAIGGLREVQLSRSPCGA